MLLLNLIYGALPEPKAPVAPPPIPEPEIEKPNPIFDAFWLEFKALCEKHNFDASLCALAKKNDTNGAELTANVNGSSTLAFHMLNLLTKNVLMANAEEGGSSGQ